MDDFAKIAATGIGGRSELLTNPSPKKFTTRECVLEKGGNTILTKNKMSTKEELYRELKKQREYYSEFLKDLAPTPENYHSRIYIDNFTVDGNKVTIPDFGGPTGVSEKTYIAEFEVNDFEDKAVYIRFEGVDYECFVYINDICVGTHEGFFSPFEFDIKRFIKKGKNQLKVVVRNDYIFMGNAGPDGVKREGSKLYAATGLGWDDPEVGWHHCPPGFGIYGKVFIDIRNTISIKDVFVRPMLNDEKAEIWVTLDSTGYDPKPVKLYLSVYGQNFEKTVVEDMAYIPSTIKTVGLGDSLTEASIKDELGKGTLQELKKGENLFKIIIDIPNPVIWQLDKPYLYSAIVKVESQGKMCDANKTQFGMRSFSQDTKSDKKGMFYLNGNKIRLRGANTMGFEQQDILNGDISQLIEDIILAKIANMNLLRLTQRPVQKEVYEYCDRLGLMTQTDLPLFGVMQREKFCEGVRQTEEMIKHVRGHACNVIISYINEPMPNASNEPHRHLSRPELEKFFDACDIVVKLNNPDQVIKHIDGDYDPPCKTMPDNHCYPMWYNAHGIDIGKLNKGYWLSVKPNWYYGCGEFGAEGLDFPEIIRKYYPKEWTKEPFDPARIIMAQTANFHYFFYDTQDTLENWVEKSQEHQAFATRIMTESFRRNSDMVTFAIHLFIDAWPSGWMKTIMDFKRNPKPAYFAYKNALEPLMLSLRTDKFKFFEDEKISVECYICNDTDFESNDCKTVFELYNGCGDLVSSSSSDVHVEKCTSEYAVSAVFKAPKCDDREKYTLKAILVDKELKPLTYTTYEIEVLKDNSVSDVPENTEIISMLEPGEYEIAGEKVTVKPCGMLPVHFVSRKTGHKAVAEFKEDDFRYWYNEKEDMITPILYNTFEAEGFTPILTSGNMDDNGNWHTVMAAGEKCYNGKRYVICQVDLRTENPIAKRFLNKINSK